MQASAGDGAPVRTHLQRLLQNTGRLDPMLAESLKPLPPAIAPLWDLFAALSHTRALGGAITYTELEGWQRAHGVRLTSWEVETLMAMDRAVRSAPKPKDTTK